jgi:anti-sigma regulatory factor (Ser/Thr protein kinase)
MSLTRTLIKTRVPIHNQVDVVVACQKGRMLAQAYGFSTNEQYIAVTAISEVAHNIVNYAQQGEIILDIIEQGKRCALMIVATDSGRASPTCRRRSRMATRPAPGWVWAFRGKTPDG